MCALSHVQFFATLWTVAHQAPLSREFPRQEYWSGLPFPSPGDLPDPGVEPVSLMSPALADESFTTEPLGKPCRPKNEVLIRAYFSWILLEIQKVFLLSTFFFQVTF